MRTIEYPAQLMRNVIESQKKKTNRKIPSRSDMSTDHHHINDKKQKMVKMKKGGEKRYVMNGNMMNSRAPLAVQKKKMTKAKRPDLMPS